MLQTLTYDNDITRLLPIDFGMYAEFWKFTEFPAVSSQFQNLLSPLSPWLNSAQTLFCVVSKLLEKHVHTIFVDFCLHQ